MFGNLEKISSINGLVVLPEVNKKSVTSGVDKPLLEIPFKSNLLVLFV
jgi:hypothetical protein